MHNANAWISEYAKITSELAAWMDLENHEDIERRLSAVEDLITQRQNLLDQLQEQTLDDDQKNICRAYISEIELSDFQIVEGLNRIKSELAEGLEEIRVKRAELNAQSKANRSYAGSVTSSEGYFIDHRK